MASPPSGPDPEKPLVYEWYVVFILILASMVSFIDRQVITLLVQPIREDLGISDTEISLLMGMAFAIFYVTMGVPIARLSDTYSRKRIIAAGIFLWSCATAACGLARNFWQLFLARIGVGVGEASLIPAAYSMISDYFPEQKLGRAIGAFATSIYLGAGMALVLGGYAVRLITEAGSVTLPVIGTIQPWQTTFIVVGLPGLILVVLMLATVREPRRRSIVKLAESRKSVPIAELAAFMWLNRKTLASIFLGYAAGGIGFYAFLFWVPEFLRRTYGWDASTAGIVFGSELAILGTAGAFMGGWFCDWLTSKGYRDAPLRGAALVFIACAPLMALTPLMPSASYAVTMLAVLSFVMSLQQALTPVAIQLTTPNQMRAQVTALYFLVASFSAIGFGATSVALLTDYVFADDDALRYSLSIVGIASMTLGALSLRLGWKPYEESLDRSGAWREEANTSGM